MTMTYGSAEHAEWTARRRHPGAQTAMAWLAFSHLPDTLQSLSRPIYGAAEALLDRIELDSAELTTALNKLVEAKDWMVRAGIRNDEGKPGPVSRPATVVDPPKLGDPGTSTWSNAAGSVTTVDLPPFGPAGEAA